MGDLRCQECSTELATMLDVRGYERHLVCGKECLESWSRGKELEGCSMKVHPPWYVYVWSHLAGDWAWRAIDLAQVNEEHGGTPGACLSSIIRGRPHGLDMIVSVLTDIQEGLDFVSVLTKGPDARCGD